MPDLDPLSADFASRFPDSFARTLTRTPDADIDRVLAGLPPEVKAAVVARLPGPRIDELLSSGEHEPESWLVDASFEDAVTLLSRIPREERLALVNSLKDRERRQQLLRHQQYPAHSVGALVGDIPIRFSSEAPVVEALVELRELGGEDPGALVVVDRQGRYLGMLDTWKLLSRQRPAGTVGDYLIRVPAIFPETSIVNAADNPDWDRHSWLPVIDQRRRVLGAVSRASILKAARKLAGETGRASDFTLDLLSELVYVLGDMLDNVLTRKSAL